MIRLLFRPQDELKLQKISWDDWFQKFDERNLALVYQDRTATGKPSLFNKIVSRESLEQKPAARRQPAKTRASEGVGY
jgi:hypothetical protein